MPFFQPAARAHQVKRHLALDVREPPINPPGAGNGNPHLYKELDHSHDGPTFLTTDAPVLANVQASSIGDIPTPSTSAVIGGSTSMATPGGLPLSSPFMLSASSNIILSSSSPSSPISTLTRTTVASGAALQSPVFGSTMRGGMISSVPAESADSALSGENDSSRPSGGVIAAIVIILLLALCAVAFFVFRRHRIQRRVARRATWTTKHPFDVTLEKGVERDPAVSSNARIETANQLSKEGGNGLGNPPPQVRNIARKPPPLSISPVSPIALSPSQSQISTPDARAPSMDSASVSTVPSTPMPEMAALVRMTFVPQLPDELAITPGETLYIRSKFDDGWALCVNSGGKQGMVPLECLEGGGGQFAGLSHLRTMRRASSLRP